MPIPGSAPRSMQKRITPRNSTQPLPKRGVRSRAETQNRDLIAADHAASNCVRANPVKRFVLSNVRSLKHVGRLRAPQQVHAEHIPVNTTYFIAGESVFLSPRFLVWESIKVQSEHVTKSNGSRISQISYREMNIFCGSGPPKTGVFRKRISADTHPSLWKKNEGASPPPQ